MNYFFFRFHNTVLAGILALAALAHFLRPDLFLPAMPPYIPWHRGIILSTGILELLFAFGLIYGPLINITSKLLILYFIAILPAHIHVSINQIAMFGVNNSLLLWGRTLFQGVFIFWAFKCQHKKESS